MNKKTSMPDERTIPRWAQILVAFVWLAVIMFCFLHRDWLTVESIAGMSSGSVIHAVLMMLGLFMLILRALGLLPQDVVSAYTGAAKTRYAPYLLGALAGMANSCILFPILGMSITDCNSKQFWIAAALQLLIMAVSAHRSRMQIAAYPPFRSKTEMEDFLCPN